jgi:ABC-type anion transport system duplicated permease subunit
VNFWTFVVAHRAEIFSRTVEHLLLVAAAMFAAILIGIPLGIALVRRQNLRRWVLGAANVIQTIPSLALFGFPSWAASARGPRSSLWRFTPCFPFSKTPTRELPVSIPRFWNPPAAWA